MAKRHYNELEKRGIIRMKLGPEPVYLSYAQEIAKAIGYFTYDELHNLVDALKIIAKGKD